ncbi:hypothetical protein F5X99DRAFT_406068 [Biscogniauxia marginata]|nr:hypothetical protein F5X99DRAFT_406068 [Biscogniauxia marginata]
MGTGMPSSADKMLLTASVPNMELPGNAGLAIQGTQPPELHLDSYDRSEAQSFYVNTPFVLSMSVNVNLVNTEYLRKFL